MYRKGQIEFAFLGSVNELDSMPEWAISGGNLLPVDLDKERFRSDVARRANGTGLMTKGTTIYMVVKENSILEDFTEYAKSVGMDYAIFLDGGGSTQLNYKGKGVKSDRRISTAVVLNK